MSISVNNIQYGSIHFTGIFGSGMSAIAQYLACKGVNVSGSDRLIDAPDSNKVKESLISCGCKIFPQDGSAVSKSTNAVCVSTAIEESNPDIAAARELGIAVVHRSDVLAALVRESKSIAVAGTSGKSTVTAMIFELLTACGMSPSLISGAALKSLEQKGMLGNSFCGESDLLVIEADESDGTLVKYSPYACVILNISKDHKPQEEVFKMFEQLIKQSKWSAINADDNGLSELSASAAFGFANNAGFRGIKTKLEPMQSTITVDNENYTLPVPGEHNASNLLAALCVCKHLGCDSKKLAQASANYKGVDRRFSITRTRSGVTVIDDFAHNPEKIRAAVETARKLSNELIAIYQPHGFGPTRFLKNEYAQTFKNIFRPADKLCLLPIYYAGGTATKDIQSQDIIDLMGDVDFKAITVENRDEAMEFIRSNAKQNSCVILMGARDPSLSGFARRIAETL
ncbi:MAG: Mur ligase domain-containing protein [Chitinispirillales bacterium]|nr:Mur ligase domain-containing protein [Chitinispirillales bacterium]